MHHHQGLAVNFQTIFTLILRKSLIFLIAHILYRPLRFYRHLIVTTKVIKNIIPSETSRQPLFRGTPGGNTHSSIQLGS
jgi:hypothetical protein